MFLSQRQVPQLVFDRGASRREKEAEDGLEKLRVEAQGNMYKAEFLVLYSRRQSVLLIFPSLDPWKHREEFDHGLWDQLRAQLARGTAPQSAGTISASRPEQVAQE